MARYDFKVGNTVTNARGPMVTQPPVTYHNVDDEALVELMRVTDDNAAAMYKYANKGGPITVTGTREVIMRDGGKVPDGATATMTVDGVTYDGLVDIEETILLNGLKITRGLGRKHAAKKKANG